MIDGVLHIHRAERADALADGLATLLSEPLDDAMQAEIVSVPTRGVERWLTQRLSSRLGASPGRSDGVCANLDFPFPGRLVGRAVAGSAGVDAEADPWLPERSVWPLLAEVDASLAQPWLSPLAAHLGVQRPAPDEEAAGCVRRFTTVRHLADLFDRYAVHRPGMLLSWAAGGDVDGAGGPLRGDAAWQAELWRRLRARIAEPSPAERLGAACDRLRAEASRCDLPDRLSLFGLTRLPSSYLQVLRALALARDVHLFLLHPSPLLWAEVAVAARARSDVMARRDDPTVGTPANPLLASWGRDTREMQLVLAAGAGSHVDHHHRGSGPEGQSLLQRVQADIRADRRPPGAPLVGRDTRAALDPSDRSIQVHACHGRARQVEVVREAVLHLLADDSALEPRDVIVMCPDIEAFAPLVHAAFGSGSEEHGPRGTDLRVRLADRSLRQTNPLLATVSALLALADARVTASQVLDLAGRDPVRLRFDLDDEDLSRMEEWVVATGVRWGIDAGSRAPFKLDHLDANTWRAGLDRVLTGVAMAEGEQRLFGSVLPLDDVDSGAIDLAGRFAELLDRLHRCLADLRGAQPVTAWVAAIDAAVDALAATTEDDAWQRAEVRAVLGDVVGEATAKGPPSAASLALPEVRALLADRLRGRPTRANFRTGHLTVCTLVPMRSVPHRVVCLLGLDDGMFPRQVARDGDDLVLDEPHVGDRDARSEDRQLLLDALMAATDNLVVTYTGRDERTNAERPPAVPVGELLDVIDATVAPPGRAQVLVHHPLQPFDARNFTTGSLVPERSWSFDSVALAGALAGARARAEERHGPRPFLSGPLPPTQEAVLEVDQLVRFLQHPVRAFLRRRLGVGAGGRSQHLRDDLPVELDALERWAVGERLVGARLAGASLEACMAAEVARGVLPPGALGAAVLDDLCPTVERLVAAAGELVPGGSERSSVEVDLRLAGGRLLAGTVAGVSGNLLLTVTYSRVAPRHRLAAWARFLAVTAAHPEASYAAATIGRRREGASSRRTVTLSRLAVFAGAPEERREKALGHLSSLVELHDRGMCEPLPVYCSTSAAYAAATAAGRDHEAVVRAASGAWATGRIDKEDKDPAHVLVLGGVRPFDELLQAGACEEDDHLADAWAAVEPSRFGRYARRLWDGLLSCEDLVDR